MDNKLVPNVVEGDWDPEAEAPTAEVAVTNDVGDTTNDVGEEIEAEELTEEKVDPTLEEQVEELKAQLKERIEAEELAEEEVAEEDPAAEIVEQIKALEEEDPGAEIDAKIEELKAVAELARLSEDAQAMLMDRMREIWLAEFTEAEQAKLRKSFIPGVRAKGKKKLLPIKQITDLRFFAEGSEVIFYLSLVKQGHFHLKVFHKPGA